MSLIRFEDVSFSYEGSDKKAIQNISLKVDEGEFVGIVGGTGEGKTTLVRCLNGLIPNLIKGEFKGKVIVGGLDTRKTKVSEMAGTVGFVFQDPDDQIFALDVWDEITFAPENFGLSDEEVRGRVEAAAEMVGITHLLDKETNNLSKGQRQLVCVASVLALNPKVMVLDEPTASLDFNSTRKIYETLKKLNEAGKTIIVVEHKTNFLSENADRILFLDGGKLAYDLPPNKLFQDVKAIEKRGVEIPVPYLLSHKLKSAGKDANFSNLDDVLDYLVRGLTSD
ncbi:MAG: ABC transporter ATP-binding protein [Candidatus Diapherotrites archaeon]|nr:ABC transporter ATP-binding protein [Candidatus Diapherotrites archaeon]